eukprot:TRINITY_DN49149_c0_g1_i1.p1 TRINITY_DN49149_c0_g1~~TRINITY_DN49149_c0_g1_i1.p1  ORF type:complete len:261 (+),score=34.72 TRINITY_DN49149_c0_g1_i1:67-849(+)
MTAMQARVRAAHRPQGSGSSSHYTQLTQSSYYSEANTGLSVPSTLRNDSLRDISFDSSYVEHPGRTQTIYDLEAYFAARDAGEGPRQRRPFSVVETPEGSFTDADDVRASFGSRIDAHLHVSVEGMQPEVLDNANAPCLLETIPSRGASFNDSDEPSFLNVESPRLELESSESPRHYGDKRRPSQKSVDMGGVIDDGFESGHHRASFQSARAVATGSPRDSPQASFTFESEGLDDAALFEDPTNDYCGGSFHRRESIMSG